MEYNPLNKNIKVVVGLSGGVDSAVSLLLLKEAGYDVEAMFMRNWDSSLNNDVLGNPHTQDDVCPQEVDYIDALKTAEELGVKLHRIDFVSEYWDKVFTYFLDEYKAGRTPNPDVLCNKEIKFKAFLEQATKMGFDYIAMGHYARLRRNGDVELLRGIDPNKDQTYFLHQLTKSQLEKAMFPIGDLTKAEVRKIAIDHNLTVATKKDSTGICFIGERNFKNFLQNYIPTKPGNIETLDGEVVGTHEGIMYYTIGQRHGLKLGGAGDAWFVVGKDIPRNVLIVGRGENQEYLYSNRAIISHVNWLKKTKENLRCTVKFRYRSNDIKVSIKWISEEIIEVIYEDKAKAVTPGQSAVFYDGEVVLGGGTIEEVYYNDQRRQY